MSDIDYHRYNSFSQTMVSNSNKFATKTEAPAEIDDSVNEIANDLTEAGDLGWWIEVFTAQPACIYYFGTYEDAHNAQAALPGFTKDLLEEGAKGMISRIIFHKPPKLTIELDPEAVKLQQSFQFYPGTTVL